MLITKLIKNETLRPFYFNSWQDSTNPVRQAEKTTAGEAGVCSGGGQDQKGKCLRLTMTFSEKGWECA